MPELQMYKGVVYLWKYVPNLPAAISFAILFALAATVHTFKMVRTSMWYCTPFVVGGFCEILGYAFRVMARYDTGSLMPFVLQGVFLLLPPVFFAATLYMVYSRVVQSVQGERFSLVSPRWCTRVFVIADVLCLSMQSVGGSLLASPTLANTGDIIIVAGLVFQCVVFFCFVCCCIQFHKRFRSHLAAASGSTNIPWESMLRMLYNTSILITLRNVFRLIEHAMGTDAYLLQHEWPVYIFDGLFMLIVMVLFYIWYPDRLQKRSTDSMIELNSNGDAAEQQELVGKPRRAIP